MNSWVELAVQIAEANRVGNGTKVSVFATTAGVLDAVSAFVAEVYRRGGLPEVLYTADEYDFLALQHASSDVLRQPSAMQMAAMEWSDVHVSFRGMALPQPITDLERLADLREGKGIVSTARWCGTRWTLVRVPSLQWADMIGVPFSKLESEFLAGTLADWDVERARMSELCRILEGVQTVRIKDSDTDLTLGCKGRIWVPFAGEANLPDGEVATAPIEDAVDGLITFPGRFWFGSARIVDLRLEFDRGLVVAASAAEGQEFLDRILEVPGARRVGELGIGTNPAIQTFTGDLLIDEKILGTVHIALGRSYPECGGLNQSAIHWDIVKDLRESGTLKVDERVLIDGSTVYHPLACGS